MVFISSGFSPQLFRCRRRASHSPPFFPAYPTTTSTAGRHRHSVPLRHRRRRVSSPSSLVARSSCHSVIVVVLVDAAAAAVAAVVVVVVPTHHAARARFVVRTARPDAALWPTPSTTAAAIVTTRWSRFFAHQPFPHTEVSRSRSPNPSSRPPARAR